MSPPIIQSIVHYSINSFRAKMGLTQGGVLTRWSNHEQCCDAESGEPVQFADSSVIRSHLDGDLCEGCQLPIPVDQSAVRAPLSCASGTRSLARQTSIFSLPTSPGCFARTITKSWKPGRKLQFEEVATQDDGLHRYLSLKFPLRNELGSIYAVAGISTDVTEQIRDRHQIVSLQNRQQRILESVGDGICGLDVEGRVAF